MTKAHIWIVSPAFADANNGNWQSASRWARFLRTRYRVTLARQWPDAGPTSCPAPCPDARADGTAAEGTAAAAAANATSAPATRAPAAPPDLLIALHARRSAASLDAWTRAYPDRPSILLLTGTDLYRDIDSDASAQRSLRQASALVVLQADGVNTLPPLLRAKTSIIHQSAATLRPAPTAARRHADICMIGHLRAEKDPLTFMHAAALVQAPSARLIHIGGALEPALGEAAHATASRHPRYHWLGAMPHADTRQRLKRSRAMALTSHMEGGANVIIEAVCAGVPVLASDIGGNRGMLGDDYQGYFPPGDAAALARLIDRVIEDDNFHAALSAQCGARAPLFAPATEQAALLDLVDNLLHQT
ncbi:putative glycosyltransferase (TIGR04348 family) [Duganella sp. 1224]|uniref:selenoneine biosynthesis selenosugar synthase SenB n=1 Tax=Duganella sp. 1224 TaxID=2587052 RepID=UPI0015CB2145|nr:putative glycosyltransferase (TIGR04348 family) [Duganella sp. 1224]